MVGLCNPLEINLAQDDTEERRRGNVEVIPVPMGIAEEHDAGEAEHEHDDQEEDDEVAEVAGGKNDRAPERVESRRDLQVFEDLEHSGQGQGSG